VLMGLAFLLPTYWPQLGLRLGVALVFVAITPIRTMVLAGWFGRSEIARANGIFNSGFGAVQTAGFWVSGALLDFVGGWREMLVVFGGLTAAGALAWVVIARLAPPPLAHVRVAGSARGGRSWLRVARHREVLALSVIGVGGASTWAAFLTFWPAVARDTLGLSGTQSGLVLGCTAVAIIPGSLVASSVVRRLGGRRPFLLIATLVQVPTFAFFVLTGDVALLIAIGLLQGLTWMYFPILLSVPFQIQGFDEQDVALATAVFVVANGLALALGPSIAGLLGTFVPIRTVLLAFAVAPLLSTLGALVLGREPPVLASRPVESTA
jgi:predicted MFS family arabinose efflux permease